MPPMQLKAGSEVRGANDALDLDDEGNVLHDKDRSTEFYRDDGGRRGSGPGRKLGTEKQKDNESLRKHREFE